MLNSVPSAASVDYHSKKLSELAHLRALIRSSTQIIEECYRQELSLEQILEQLPQASLGQVLEVYPLRKGLAEIVTYFQVAAESAWAHIDESRTQVLVWSTGAGARREATVEHVTFMRPA